MSLSPSTSVSNSESPHKKRRTGGSSNGIAGGQLEAEGSSPQEKANTPVHIPKRGARACTACRKGKNRCEGEAPCRRCQLSGTLCVFEKPEKKNVSVMPNGSIERISRLEGQYLVMQSQMIGMQSSLDRILSAIQANNAQNVNFHPQPQFSHGNPSEHPASYASSSQSSRGLDYYSPSSADSVRQYGSRNFPPLPGFAPPPHKYATYGIVPSTAASSEDESEDTLPRSTMNAPIEAL